MFTMSGYKNMIFSICYPDLIPNLIPMQILCPTCHGKISIYNVCECVHAHIYSYSYFKENVSREVFMLNFAKT